MLLSQNEADRLLQLPKEFDPSQDQIEFRRSAFSKRYDLFEVNGRERFLLDLERSQIRTVTLKFQTRARTVFILARLDINGPVHRNRVAFLPQDIPQFSTNPPGDEVRWLVAFLRFSAVQSLPTIQTTMI